MRKVLFNIATITTTAFLTAANVMAQPGLPVVPDQVPIDGGLGFLAAAGGAYALKKLRERKQNEAGDSEDIPPEGL